jgi:hypothetical protein
MMPIVMIGIVIIAIGLMLLALTRRKKLSAAQSVRLWTLWSTAQGHTDLHRQILDADTVIAELLGALGYTGSMGDKLKSAGKRLPNENALWRAHKLRNRIAHEPGLRVSQAEAAEAMRAFRTTLTHFARRPL